MARHEVYNKDNKFLSKLKFKSKTLNILRNIVLSLVIILGLNWVIAITTDVNLLGTGLRKVFDAVEGYDHPIPSVAIESDDWATQTPGSWHIDKSAKWTGAKTAEVVFDLNTTKKYISEGLKFDVVMVLDVSTSMEGEKIEKLKESAKKYFDEILSDNDNRIAIVEFSTNATILQTFTNNKERLNNTADNLKLKCSEPNGWCTNYYAGLKKAEEVLTNYKPQEMRQLVILFLTDGSANNQNQLISVEYQTLKEKYPDSIINGIQYEMGSEINYYLKKASDNQYDATTENIYNKFFNSTYAQKLVKYDNFEIVDYIKDKYFKVNSASDISVDTGTIKLENESNGTQKIIWTLTPDFKSGMKAQMKIKLTLKDAYVKDVDKDFYPTNNGEDITWQIPGENKKTKKSTLTPVLQRIYNVIYDNNPPNDCNIAKTDIEKHYSYENVKIKDSHPTCAGYTFRGWEIVTDEIKKVNENTFVMPEGNVTIRGKWGAQSISKSMQGQIPEKPPLYEIIKNDAENNKEANTYTGEVTDEVNKTVNTNIYYYTNKNRNNVIFAGFCWQIVRTTATGGIKLLYNGIPENGTCTDNRTNNRYEIADYNYQMLIVNPDLYSDNYTFDETTGKFTLTGNVQRADAFDKHELIGKYTCYNSTGTNCSNLYKVNSLDSEDESYTYTTWYQSIHYSTIGNSTFNTKERSPSYVGYMYNTEAFIEEKNISSDFGGIIFGSSVIRNNNGYTLKDTIKVTNWGEDFHLYSNMGNHHYTCLSSTATTCSKVAYVHTVGTLNSNTSTIYYITLETATSIDELLNKMFHSDDVNKKDSNIKAVIDNWYKNNLTEYTKYLEDAVFCNDRSISSLGSWDANCTNTTWSLNFYNDFKAPTYACPNATDQFAMNNSKAQLTYPIGLLTAQEVELMGKEFAYTGEPWWVGTPGGLVSYAMIIQSVSTDGTLKLDFHNNSNGVRPSISLKPGIKPSSGSGFKDDPYVVDKLN